LICQYCLLFAAIDSAYHASFSSAFDVFGEIFQHDDGQMLTYFELATVEDVLQLSNLFQKRSESTFLNYSRAVAGGRLAGTADVGGADFDVVVDGCLWDVKARAKNTIRTCDLHQLVGYWLLDYEDEFRMESTAIYQARLGYHCRFDIRKDLLRSDDTKGIRERFREGLRHQQHA
jgi:hypothetical protein